MAKHAHATRADIELIVNDEGVRLSVRDDGVGPAGETSPRAVHGTIAGFPRTTWRSKGKAPMRRSPPSCSCCPQRDDRRNVGPNSGEEQMNVRRSGRMMVATAVVTGAAVLGLSASPASAETNDACRFQHDVTLHAEFMAVGYGGGTVWNQMHWLTVYLQHNQDLIGMGCA